MAETYDVWLLRLDSMGCLTPECGDLQILTNDEEVKLVEQKKLFEIYPNPVVDGKINISKKGFSSNISGYKLRLVNTFGQILLKNQLTEQKTDEIILNSLPIGVYFLIIENVNGQIVQVEKILIN